MMLGWLLALASSTRCARFAIPLLAALWMAMPIACSDAGPLAPRPAPPEEAAEARIAWTNCGERLECAHVQVPLDWNHPRRSKITLAVIRHLASDPERRIGSLFWNPGGPGGSLEQVRAEGKNFDAQFQGRFDIIGWDLRGTGESTHVRCFEGETAAEQFFRDWELPFTTSSSWRTLRKTAVLARRCRALSGPLLSYISTADSVRDLDYLRQLVGDQTLTYWGWSAGTFIGQTYANMFPGRVRAMALDGLVDAVDFTTGTEAWIVSMLSYTDKAWEGFLSLCDAAGPARCALAGHGSSAAARAERVLADLRRGPIGDLTYGDALTAILAAFSLGPTHWPALAVAFNAAAGGNGSDLATLGRFVTKVFSSTITPPGLPAIALICADSPAERGPGAWPSVVDRLTRASFIYGPVLAWWRWAPCASWRAQSANRYVGPWDAVTTNPILVIGSLYDPNTPYVNAVRAAERLGNAALLTHEGYGHISVNDPSACVKRATSAYLVDLVTPPPGTVCLSDHAPFDPDYGQPLP